MNTHRFALVALLLPIVASIAACPCPPGSEGSGGASASSAGGEGGATNSSSAGGMGGTGGASSSSSSSAGGEGGAGGNGLGCDQEFDTFPGCYPYVWPLYPWEGPQICYCQCNTQEDCADALVPSECGVAIDENTQGHIFPGEWPLICRPKGTCEDGKRNQAETGVDCGGPAGFECPNACPVGMNCNESDDCLSGNCDTLQPETGFAGTCVP